MKTTGQRKESMKTEATNVTPVESFIDKHELGRRLGRTSRSVDVWMRRGFVPYYKVGRSVAFKWSEVEAYLARTYRVSGGLEKN